MILPLLVNTSILSGPKGKAAALSDQFQSVFTLQTYLNWMTIVFQQSKFQAVVYKHCSITLTQ